MNQSPLELAAAIANPFDTVDLSALARDDLEGATAVLMEQKVSLLDFADRIGSAVFDTPLGPAVERDRVEFKRQRGEFERIRGAFASDGIAAMLFKSTGLRPSFHYLSSNLDVIVPEGRIADAKRRLAELGYVELLNVEEPKKFLFRRFPGDGSSYAFHLHGVVGWGVPFVDNGSLWAGARPASDDADILTPGPREALLVTLAHWFYEDKELSLGNLIGTAWALRHVGCPLSEAAGEAARFGWEEGFWAAVRIADGAWRRLLGASLLSDGQRDEVDAGLSQHAFVDRSFLPSVSYEGDVPAVEPFMKNKVVYYRKILRDPSRTAWQRTKDVAATFLWAIRWKLHVRSQRPLLVAVGGCDGSGKTIQVGRLENAFCTCDIRVKVLWSRGASSRFMGTFIRMGKRVAGPRAGDGASEIPKSGGEEGKTKTRRRSLRNPVLRFLFSALYALDLAWVYCVKTRWWLWTGNVVVADRYVADALVDYEVMSGQPAVGPPAALRLLRAAAPTPALPAILDVEPEEALRRKPEEGGAAHLEAARAAFLALADGGSCRVFPAEWTIEAVNRRLVKESLTRFYDRYGTAINWLLWSNPNQLNRR